MSPNPLPCDPVFQNGWHQVLYDAVTAPDGESLFLVPWNARPILMRFWPDDGEWGHMETVGRLTRDEHPSRAFSMNVDHVGGLVVGMDGALYVVVSDWQRLTADDGPRQIDSVDGILLRYDIDAAQFQEAGRFRRPDAPVFYISRGAVDANGDLFFGTCLNRWPVGIFRVRPPQETLRQPPPLRVWG